jgi:hypothetical protein
LTKPIATFPGDAGIWVLALVLIVALLWGGLLVLDILKAYKERRDSWFPLVRDLLREAGRDGDLDPEELRHIVTVMSKGPTGIPGLGRISIGATVATVIAVVLVLLIVFGDQTDQDLVKIVVGGLLSAFSTIIGFYFGSKTASEARDKGMQAGSEARDEGMQAAAQVLTHERARGEVARGRDRSDRAASEEAASEVDLSEDSAPESGIRPDSPESAPDVPDDEV